jgi:hypothetical protein
MSADCFIKFTNAVFFCSATFYGGFTLCETCYTATYSIIKTISVLRKLFFYICEVHYRQVLVPISVSPDTLFVFLQLPPRIFRQDNNMCFTWETSVCRLELDLLFTFWALVWTVSFESERVKYFKEKLLVYNCGSNHSYGTPARLRLMPAFLAWRGSSIETP